MQRNPELGPIHAPIMAGVERLWANKRLFGRVPDLWLDGTGLNPRAKTLTCRQTGTVLSEMGAGASPDLAAYGPHLGAREAAFAAANYLQAAGNDFGDIRTEHFILEHVGLVVSGANTRPVNKRGGSGNGWTLISSITGQMAAYFSDGVAGATITSAAMDGQRGHLIGFFHRSGFGQWYFDGVASGAAVDISGAALSLTRATPFTVGANSIGGAPYAGTIGQFAMWKGDDLLDTHLQPDLAKERASLWLGHSLLHNHGSLTPSTL